MDRAKPEDRAIMQEVMQGYSYEEIAKKHGTNKMDIARRLQRYAHTEETR